MHIRCPHCRHPIDVVGEASLCEVPCPSCGSSFSLAGGDSTETFRGDTRRIAHFELVRELGMGKFGSVWLARDTTLDRTVAIKIPRKGALDPLETELFLRDARAAAQLKHPNIVGVHEVGRELGAVYIVSDYIAGANLKEWLSRQRLSFRESAELVVKVAEAIDYAHQSGVVHRDLKPSNIMLDAGGQPHITDFGLAKREAGEITMTVDGHILGTPAYMSPEQAGGMGHHADRRSDVYSLGVILFELLTGKLPFGGVQMQRDRPPRPRRLNADIPRDLEGITLKCLEKEPARRYDTAQALANDLRRWLDGRPIATPGVGRARRAWLWAKSNPLSVASSAGVVLLFLAVFGLFYYDDGFTTVAADEVSTDEVRLLEQRVSELDVESQEIQQPDEAADKMKAATERAHVDYELAAAHAVLAWAQRDKSLALADMEVACQGADRFLEYTRTAVNEESQAVDYLLSAIEMDATGNLALARLKRSLEGERNDWFHVALVAPPGDGVIHQLNLAMMAPVGGAEMTEILVHRVEELQHAFARVQVLNDAGEGGGEVEQLYRAGCQLFTAKSELDESRKKSAQAVLDQYQAVEFADKWADVERGQLDGDSPDFTWLHRAERARDDTRRRFHELQKVARINFPKKSAHPIVPLLENDDRQAPDEP